MTLIVSRKLDCTAPEEPAKILEIVGKDVAQELDLRCLEVLQAVVKVLQTQPVFRFSPPTNRRIR